jgi:hypothetical protein
MNKAAFIEGALQTQFALDELGGILNHISSYREEHDKDT